VPGRIGRAAPLNHAGIVICRFSIDDFRFTEPPKIRRSSTKLACRVSNFECRISSLSNRQSKIGNGSPVAGCFDLR